MTNAPRGEPEPATLILKGRGGGGRPALAPSEAVFAWAVCGLLFLEHLAFGGGRRAVAFGFVCAQGLMLAAAVAWLPWARRALCGGRALAAAGVLYLGVILAAILSMTPYAPGGPHPVWTYVPAPAAATIDRGATLLEIIRLLGLGCLGLMGWILGAADERARYFLTLVAGGLAAYACWAFAMQLVDPQTIYGFVAKPGFQDRLTGSFFSPNTAGTFMAMASVLLTAWLMERLRGSGRPFSPERVVRRAAPQMAGLVFALAAAILTASRGALSALCVGLAVLLVWEALARRWRLWGPAGISLMLFVGGLLALAVLSGDYLFARLLHVADDASVRYRISLAHWQAFQASAPMGYGLGAFNSINRLITTSQTYPDLWNIHATHNAYIQWLEEGGVIGAAPMFACIAVLLWVTVAGALRRTRMTTWLRALAVVSMVVLIHAASDYALQIPSMSGQWACLLVLGAGLASRPRGETARAAAAPLRSALVGGGIGLFGLLTAALGLAVTVQLADPWARLPALPFSQTLDDRADRVLSTRPAEAAALSAQALAVQPTDARAWLRLARLQAGRGRLGEAGESLNRSYAVAPYDPQLLTERVAFVFDHWTALPVDIQNQAASEVDAAWSVPALRGALGAAVTQVKNPGGRMLLGSRLFGLRIADSVARSPGAPGK